MFFYKLFIGSFIVLQILNFMQLINCNENFLDNINVSNMKDYLMNEIFLVQNNINQEYTDKKYDYLKSNVTVSNQNESEKSETNEVIRDKSKTFVDYYNDGVKAYLASDWELCINHLERSLIMYHEYYEGITTCRVRCENERERYETKFLDSIYFKTKDQNFYESLIFKTLCLERCRMITLPNLPRYFMFFQKEKEIFKTRKPYEYLQICYYRDKEIEKAISATYTALIANPNDPILRKNIKFYSELKEYDYNKLQDFEDKRFSKFYRDALDKYEKNEWEHAVELFEVAMDIWLQELEKCRAFCEGEFNQGWLPDFATAISNHYVYSLRCKVNCTNELTLINGRHYEDIFPHMYDYLQYAYYKSNDTKGASQCASSNLLFYPNSETMQKNIEFYRTLPDAVDEYFQPRPEAKKVFYRNLYEQDLLDYIDEEFIKLLNEDDTEESDSNQKEDKTEVNSSVQSSDKEKSNEIEDSIIETNEQNEESNEIEQNPVQELLGLDENKNQMSFGQFINDLFTRY